MSEQTKSPDTAMEFDLIYTISGESRVMSAMIFGGVLAEPKEVGPFPAKEAGPRIVDALVESGMPFANRRAAESAYMIRHFMYIDAGHNRAGMTYPYHLAPEAP